MERSGEAVQFLEHVRARWKVVAITWAVAIGLSLAVSLMLPEKYTATARIVIEPPAGSDVRSSMVVSPIYFEALRTYEHFASSDSLFAKALEKFQLRQQYGASPVEAVKKRVLEVTLPRNTRILEIRATLPDPKKAHELAAYLAEETVKLNRSANESGDQDLLETAEKQLQRALTQRDHAETEWVRIREHEPVDTISTEIESLQFAKSYLQRQLYQEELSLAEGPGAADPADTARAKTRVGALAQRIAKIDQDVAAKQALVEGRTAHREQAEAKRKTAQTTVDAAESRVRDARSDAGHRGDRLRVLDPGIVPERRSSPNIPLNVMAAWLIATLLSIAYLTFEFSMRSRNVATPRHTFETRFRE